MLPYEAALHDAFWLVLVTTLPIIGAIIVSSLLTGVFQALTRVNDTTVSLIAHAIAAALIIIPLGYWMLSQDARFLTHALEHVSDYLDGSWR